MAAGEQGRLLVVDDEESVRGLLQRVLEGAGYEVVTAADGQEALARMAELREGQGPDLVLSDVMMPGMDGYELCRRIREFSQVPIVMVTARGKDEDKIKGLEAGADDYVPKPFSSGELLARVKAVLRRARLPEERPEPTFRSEDLVVDFAKQKVVVDGQEVDLSGTEYRLLSYLAHNAGRELSPDRVLEAVWGKDYIGEHDILRVNVGRLKHKMGGLKDIWSTGLNPEDWMPK
ncbi:response regulator transcription factor [Chloroflexota bacterium]